MYQTRIAHRGEPFPGSAFQSPIYRIPAVTVTSTGRIIVAYDVRSDWRDLPADFDIATRFSDDGGRTWSSPTALRAHTPGHGFGDASLIYDPETGCVFCWYVGSQGPSYFSAEAGGPGLELWLGISRDNGETWEHRDMSHIRPEGVAGMFTSSGNGAVAEDGTLLQPFVARINNENYAICASSSDRGETWNMGTPVGPGCDENKVVALADGKILMHARARPLRHQAVSVDMGNTFGEVEAKPGLVDPACNGGLVRMDGLLVASMCDDAEHRHRLCLHTSEDNGHTWSEAVLIDDGAAAYSALCVIDENTLGIVWEADDYESIMFASCTVHEIGEGGFAVRHGKPGYAKPPVVNDDSSGVDA